MINKKILLMFSIITLIIFLNIPKYANAQSLIIPNNVIKLEFVKATYVYESSYTYEYSVTYKINNYFPPKQLTHDDYILFTGHHIPFKRGYNRGTNSYKLESYRKDPDNQNNTLFYFTITILQTFVDENAPTKFEVNSIFEQIYIYIKDELTYQTGYNQGYTDGYNQGFLAGSENPSNYNFVDFISSIFSGIGTIFSINLLPGISIGAIVAVPLVFGIIAFILGKRGGN